MSDGPLVDTSWAERAVARSPVVQRSRQRSIEQTERIVRAAMRLVEQKGSAFTIQELAKKARVALQTFYRQFAGKDELLLAVIEWTIADATATFRTAAQQLPDPISRLRFYITTIFSSLADPRSGRQRQFITSEHYRLQQLFPEELSAAVRAYTDLLVPEIEAAQAAGLLAPSDIQSDASFVTELVMATYHHYAFVAPPGPTSELSESIWQFCVRALGGGDAATTAR